jgi:16S rRNA (cytidine1402-2'-O)-methyltransferase
MTDQPPDQVAKLGDRVRADVERLLVKPLAPGLHVVATPIGNLGDMTLRALTTLSSADLVYCEDTRHSGALFAHFAVAAKLRPYHEHNAAAERPRILARLAAGDRIALISDAGTPLISDPGYKLVREVIAAGHAVHALPGPCAAIAALTVSALPTDSFFFAGFLPARSGQRQVRLQDLAKVPASLVFYEAPTRVADALADMAKVLGDRPAVIARELTKLHEEVIRGSLAGLATSTAMVDFRGEIAIVVAPPLKGEVTDAEITAALIEAKRTSSTRDAVRSVAEGLAVSRSRVYNLATLAEQGDQ